MRFNNFRQIFITLIFMLLFVTILSAQEPGESQRDYIKKQVQYDRWQDILSTKPEVSYDEFKLDSAMVSPWFIQRTQEIGAAERGNMVQYLLTKSMVVKEAQEILLVSVTLCSTRDVAAEGLIDHLLGIQRPDFKLIEEDSLTIGDLTVNITAEPEPAIFFFRGNIIISVENSCEKVTAELRELTQTLDEYLKEKRR